MRNWLEWPFFDARHRELAARLDAFVALSVVSKADHSDVDATCRKLVRSLGDARILTAAVAPPESNETNIDTRSVCVVREALAYGDGLADFAFAMQGLGSGAISIAAAPELKRAVLPKTRSGEWLAAFALAEKDAGSDVGAMSCVARAEADHYVIDGEMTGICNGGIADVYCLFARTDEGPGARRLSGFVILSDDPGFSAQRIDATAQHPLANLRLENCRIPASRRLGAPGGGLKLAMQTLDIFRASIAAAAVGFARRALDEALAYARERGRIGATLAELQLRQAALAEMATEIDAATLLTYRAAWRRDVQRLPTTREAAMAKMTATESAQRVIDRAAQMFGRRGARGKVVKSLHREIRALRIYEGATEAQKHAIARDLLKARE